ncbi:hypothetical protein [Paraburkholderia caribensis]|uniref:hypothetical protein n=1 Tax=Paraburkholderia caribensis TaxID=75105 RepID=UPI0034D1DF42
MSNSYGPDSFALDNSGNVVTQQPTPTPGGPQITLQGGGGQVQQGQASLAPGGEFGAAAAQSAASLNALNKLTQGMLQPYIAAEQKRLYFEGMSQVAQGRTLQQVEAEHPWYTQIFGPSATVRGAQAMTAMTALTQAQNQFMEDMPNLRQRDPDTVRKYLVDQATQIGNTGDPLVDGLVQSKLAEQWGTMLDTHMKQHLAWQQEDMGQKFVNNTVASGKLLQSTLHEATGYAVTSDEAEKLRQDETQKFTDTLLRPYGMTDESYGKYMASAARANLSNGNFEAYNALKRNGDMWNAIPMDARVQLENEEELWTQKALKKAPALADIGGDQTKLSMSLIQGTFPGDEKALNDTIDGINSSWRARSGAATDVIDNHGRDLMLKQFYAGRNKVNTVIAKAQAGLADDQAQRTSALAAINGGTSSILPSGVSEQNAQLTSEEFWQNTQGEAQGNPQAFDNGISKLALVSDEKKLRPASLESQLRQDSEALFVTGGSITPRAQQSLQVMQKLLTVPGGGPAALANYIGSDNAKKVAAFIGSGVDVNDPKGLETTRSWLKNGSGAVATKADRDAAASYVSGQDPGFFKRMLPIFGGPGSLTSYDLNDATKASIASDLAPYVATTKKAFPSMSDEQAAQFAYSQVYGNLNNTDFIDGTIVKHNPYVGGAQSLYQGVQAISKNGVNQANDDYQWAVKEVARGNLKDAVGQGADKLNIAHAGDPLYVKADLGNFNADNFQAVGGEQLAHGIVTVYYQNSKNGQVYPVLIRPEQVRDKYEERLNRNRTGDGAPVVDGPFPSGGVGQF